ncbi:MAG: sugar phosphate isomerase/epimerase [Chloroflexota bacterium]|nr:sugar phosphate isomerase/epimerase [Chloroflexota bacterium]
MRLRLGVAGGPVPRDPSHIDEPLARRLAGLGVRVLTTHFQPTPQVVSTHARRVRSVLAEHGLTIVQATGYNPQLTHPDDEVLSTELERLRAAFDTAQLLGAEMIISGCGSRHPSHFYGPHPDNHAPATRERLIASLRRAAPWAQDAGVVLALECHVTTALDTPEHIREIVQAVDSAWVRANFDPVNLLGDFSKVWHNGEAMRHMWRTVGACYAQSAHIKDVRADPELVVHISEAPPGQGLLDLDAFFEVVTHLGQDTAVIVEHLPPEEAIAAITYVHQAAAARNFIFG